jgi:hypothetical protein
MRTHCLRSGLALIACLFFAGRSLAGEGSITQEELVRRTQELMNAIVSGDPAPWRKYYADDCMFHDEKGRSLGKAALVADITPLPNGYSGTVKVANPQSVVTSDTAILSYDSIETETIFGQQLHARYHGIDTWLRRNDQWQIVAAQTMRYYEDPATGTTDPAKFPAYAGAYQLSPGSGRRTTISFQKEKLFLERTPAKKIELFPESGDLFFRKGVEGRILFHFSTNGKVDLLIDRRNNEDVIWKKIE